MKRIGIFTIVLSMILSITACGSGNDINIEETVQIALSDGEITVNGVAVSSEETNGVHVAKDIVYYETGHDFTYGEGEEKDAHTSEEAMSHNVVHITKPGTYSLSGKLSKGQIAVDLGEDAKKDETAVVTLVLNGADITCGVAPAVIFYNVYECGNDDAESATKDVDTSKAGARIVIMDDTVNTVNGAYVARIYEPGTVVICEDGTEVEDAEKLHKYDGAFYSKMSMTVDGGKKGNGVLNINAENEGLDSELHLTINGGNININSGNDGINTNEDNVSVTTINGGNLKINVNGATGEGDGIDSNGWLVINGGMVTAEACSVSGDAGIDSDKGIHINGGTVIATGNMLDRIEDGGSTYAVFNFAERQKGGVTEIVLKDEKGNAVLSTTPQNDYSILIYSNPDLKEGTYTLWSDDAQLSAQSGGAFGGRGGRGPGGERPEMPQGQEPPENFDPETMKPKFDPENMPEGFKPDKRPNGEGTRPERPEGAGERPEVANGEKVISEPTTEFKIVKGANMFQRVSKNQ